MAAPFAIEPLGGPAWAADFERISDGWRPYRTWIAVLMRSVAA